MRIGRYRVENLPKWRAQSNWTTFQLWSLHSTDWDTFLYCIYIFHRSYLAFLSAYLALTTQCSSCLFLLLFLLIRPAQFHVTNTRTCLSEASISVQNAPKPIVRSDPINANIWSICTTSKTCASPSTLNWHILMMKCGAQWNERSCHFRYSIYFWHHSIAFDAIIRLYLEFYSFCFRH